MIRHCTVSGCGLCGVYVYQYGRPVIEGCEISHAGAEGIAVAHQSAPEIRRCTGVGIGFAPGCRGIVEACRLDNTAAPGISIAAGATPEVIASADPSSPSGQGDEKLDGLLGELDAMLKALGVLPRAVPRGVPA